MCFVYSPEVIFFPEALIQQSNHSCVLLLSHRKMKTGTSKKPCIKHTCSRCQSVMLLFSHRYRYSSFHCPIIYILKYKQQEIRKEIEETYNFREKNYIQRYFSLTACKKAQSDVLGFTKQRSSFSTFSVNSVYCHYHAMYSIYFLLSYAAPTT